MTRPPSRPTPRQVALPRDRSRYRVPFGLDPRSFLTPSKRFTLLYVLLATSLWWSLSAWWEHRAAVEAVSYSQFEQASREGRVADVPPYPESLRLRPD